MRENKHRVFWPGWITRGRICGQGYGSLWELWQENGQKTATVKYITVPRSALETEALLAQGKSREYIRAYYEYLCRGADEEYAVSEELRACRHVALYRDIRKERAADGLGWDILLMMDNLLPVDRCMTAPTEEQAVKLARQICIALEDSSCRGLLHGRITPRCIFRDANGNFQLGGFAGEYCDELGDFRAPEVAENKFADTRSDVYSLGMVLYWLLNDRQLPGKDRKVPGNGSEKLKAVILKAIAPQAEDRYQTPAQMREALAAIGPKKKAPKGQKRNRLKAVLAAAAALLLIGLCVAFFPKADEPVETTPPVLQEPETTVSEPQAVETVQTTAPIEEPVQVVNHLPANTLMEDYTKSSVFRTVLGSWRGRDSIQSITFLDSIAGAPEDSWDVSFAQNGMVLAWIQQDGYENHLFIGAEGGVYAPPNCRLLFADYGAQQINFNNAFHTDYAENMQDMFYSCNDLQELDLTGWNTSNVTNMSSMFSQCESLVSLKIENLDTSSVTDMSDMFNFCCSLPKLTLSGMDTSEVEDMSYMFAGCSGLTTLDVSGFNTEHVTNMSGMFSGCSGLTSLNVAAFSTSNVEDMSGMFGGCSSLTSITMGEMDTSKVKTMHSMFLGCKSLLNLDISSFDTTSVTNMCGMFFECEKLTKLNVQNFDTSNVVDMGSMFFFCKNLRELDVTGFVTSNVENMENMFGGCPYLRQIDVTNFDVSKVKNYFGFMDYDWTINGRHWEEFFEKQETITLKVLRYTDLTFNAQNQQFAVVLDGLKNTEVKWTSLDEKVATVDENGVIRSVARGTTKIICEYGDQKVEIKVTCKW